MLEYCVSLYTDIYWTKRFFVAFAFILVICAGIRIFQFVSDRLSVREVNVGAIKPEVGYGLIPPLNLQTKPGFENFKPDRFRITTVSGNLDVENGYPQETTESPVANVYRVIEQPIDLSTTQIPLRIARDLNFTQTPQDISNTTRLWQEGGRKLLIDGQYKTIEYSNDNLKRSSPSTAANNLTNSNQNALKNIFQQVIAEFSYPLSFDSYVFTVQYLAYDSGKDKFIITESAQSTFYRIEAKRHYPSLSKVDEKAKAYAVYPRDALSNSYVILVNNQNASSSSPINSTTKLINSLVEMKLYEFPINTSDPKKNQDVQTYPIITPKEAYRKLTKYEAYLVSAKDAISGIDIEPEALEGIDLVDLLNIRLDFYEEPKLTKYIQPVYVFIAEAQNGGKKYILTYYVPAIVDSYLL